MGGGVNAKLCLPLPIEEWASVFRANLKLFYAIAVDSKIEYY